MLLLEGKQTDMHIHTNHHKNIHTQLQTHNTTIKHSGKTTTAVNIQEK